MGLSVYAKPSINMQTCSLRPKWKREFILSAGYRIASATECILTDPSDCLTNGLGLLNRLKMFCTRICSVRVYFGYLCAGEQRVNLSVNWRISLSLTIGACRISSVSDFILDAFLSFIWNLSTFNYNLWPPKIGLLRSHGGPGLPILKLTKGGENTTHIVIIYGWLFWFRGGYGDNPLLKRIFHYYGVQK